MITTDDLARQWLRGPVRRLAPATQSQYGNLVMTLPEIAPMPEDITAKAVRRHFRSMVDTPTLANRWKSVVSSFCAWLVDEEVLEFNPAVGIRKNPERPKTAFLSERELVDLAGGLRHSQANPDSLACIRLLLSTGVRISEAVGMQWEEVAILNDGSGEWLIPGERTKSSRDLITRIPARVMLELRLLDSFALGRREGLVFHAAPGRRSGRRAALSSDAVRQTLERICARMGMKHYSPHDLRRTVGTLLAKHGVHVEVRKAVLNHSSIGVTDVHYNQYDYWKEKVDALVILEGLLIEASVI